MEPAYAGAYFGAYFGTVLRDAARGTRLPRSRGLKTYFLFQGSGTKVAIHQLTGRRPNARSMRCTGPGGGPGAAADPAVRGAGGRAVRRVAGGAGDLPEVRAGRRSYAAARLLPMWGCA